MGEYCGWRGGTRFFYWDFKLRAKGIIASPSAGIVSAAAFLPRSGRIRRKFPHTQQPRTFRFHAKSGVRRDWAATIGFSIRLRLRLRILWCNEEAQLLLLCTAAPNSMYTLLSPFVFRVSCNFLHLRKTCSKKQTVDRRNNGKISFMHISTARPAKTRKS
jgi:hypothetical protein